MKKLAILLLMLLTLGGGGAGAQSILDEIIVDGETVNASKLPAKGAKPGQGGSLWSLLGPDSIPLNPANFGPQELVADTAQVDDLTLTAIMFMPAVFDTYTAANILDEPSALSTPLTLEGPTAWADRKARRDARLRAMMQRFQIANPQLVAFNMATLPRPPKEFVMTVDPTTAHITVEEFVRDPNKLKAETGNLDLGKIHWLQKFDGSLQFSQAYVSPNWYQGGNSNLNAIANVLYNVKLNPAFHPDLIFETTFQYKLGVNNAPDDSLHSYNISEDLLQVNTTFGLKAVKHWYYSVTGQFKTQILNNYAKNSRDLKAAFLSPGELNVGVGMTYDLSGKNFNFKASLAPLSYNMKMCTNNRIDPDNFGIKQGHTTVSQIGSTMELTCNWKIAYNINYSSRLFAFTDYDYVVADWENTINFDISRFLSTRIYAHLRYQSNADRWADTAWHRWQFKEILSFGFAYHFQH